jgi:hypothetical protein
MGNVGYPAYSIISNITQGVQTVITFTEDHDFTLGEIVSFRIDKLNGMRELNNVQSRVIDMDDISITIDFNSNNFTAFVYNIDVANVPMAVPSASGVIPNDPLNTVNLLDAFDMRST